MMRCLLPTSMSGGSAVTTSHSHRDTLHEANGNAAAHPDSRPNEGLFFPECRERQLQKLFSRLTSIYPSVAVDHVEDLSTAGKLTLHFERETYSSQAKQFSYVVAAATLQQVEGVLEDSPQLSVAPPAVQVRLPHGYPVLTCDSGLAAKIAADLTSPLGGPFSEFHAGWEPAKQTIERIRKRIADTGPRSVAERREVVLQSGVLEVQLREDIRAIARPWFRTLCRVLGEIENEYAGLRTVITLAPGRKDLFRIFNGMQSAPVPWSMLVNEERKCVTVSPLLVGKTLGKEVERVQERFLALTGFELRSNQSSMLQLPEKALCFEPGVQEEFSRVVRKHRTEIAMLRSKLPAAIPEVNIQALPFSNCISIEYTDVGFPASFLERVHKELWRPSYHIAFIAKERSPQAPLPAIDFARMVESVLPYYPLRKGEVHAAAGAVILSYHNPPNELRQPWFTELRSVLDSLKQYCRGDLLLSWSHEDDDILNAAAQKLGLQSYWRISTDASSTFAVRIEVAPELKQDSEHLKETLQITYGIHANITTVPPRAGVFYAHHPDPTIETQPLTFLCLERAKRALAEELPTSLHVHSLQVDGNTIIAHVPAGQRLPTRYAAHLASLLDDYPLPVVLLYSDQETLRYSDEDMFEIASMSLPPSVYLHNLSSNDEAISLCLHRNGQLPSDLSSSVSELEAFFQRKVTIDVLPAQDENLFLIDSLPTPYAQFFAAAVDRTGGLKDMDEIRPAFDKLSKVHWLEKDVQQEWPGRIDMTSLETFSIDKTDSRVLEDCISIERTKNGNFLLGVHVLDLTAIIYPNSTLDRYAQSRGLNISQMNFGFPLFPLNFARHVASFGVAKNRPAFTLFVEIDKSGTVLHTSLQRSIISNKLRLTYENCDRILRGESHPYDSVVFRLARVHHMLCNGTQETLGGKITPHSLSREIIERALSLFNAKVQEQLSTAAVLFPLRVHSVPQGRDAVEMIAYAKKRGIYCDDVSPQSPETIMRLFGRFCERGQEEYRMLPERWRPDKGRYVVSDRAPHESEGMVLKCKATAPLRNYATVLTQFQLSTAMSGDPPLPRQQVNRYLARVNEILTASGPLQQLLSRLAPQRASLLGVMPK